MGWVSSCYKVFHRKLKLATHVECLLKNLVFVCRKGQPIFAQLLRCKALEVENHVGVPHALHLHKAWLVRKAG